MRTNYLFLKYRIIKHKRALKSAGFVVLLAIIIIAAFAVTVNVLEIETPYFNPPPETVWRYFTLTYPQNSPNGQPLTVSVNLTTRGDFAVGQKTYMYVSGSLANNLFQNLSFVYPWGYTQ